MNRLQKIEWKRVLSLMLVLVLLLGLCPRMLNVNAEASDTSTESVIPSDVIFESVVETRRTKDVGASSGVESSLGSLESTAHGFRFKLNGYTTADAGRDLRINLYNPGTNMWNAGYSLNLMLTTSGGAKWKVMKAAGDATISSGEIEEVSDAIEVYVWVSDITSNDHKLNVVIDEELVFSEKMDGSVELGKNLQVYNGWVNTVVFNAIDEVIEWDGQLPTDVMFESIVETRRVSQVGISARTEGYLGALESIARGFRFNVGGYTVADAGTEVRVGFFNPTERLWDGGYAISLFPSSTGGLDWAVLKPVGDRYIGLGKIEKISDSVEVHVWVSEVSDSGHRLNVVIDGEMVFSRKMDGIVTLGTKSYVYNGWSNTAVFSSVEDVVEGNGNIPSDVTFETVVDTARTTNIHVGSGVELGMGALESTANGFKFKVSGYTAENAGTEVRVGFFNPTERLWDGGYAMSLFPSSNGGMTWAVLKPVGDRYIGLGSIEKVSDSVEVHVWVSEVTASGHRLNVVIDGELVFSKEMDDYVELGKRLFVFNGWSNTAIISKVDEVLKWDGKLPSDVTFETVVDTARTANIHVGSRIELGMGALESTANGFKFKVSGYTATDAGTEVRVGFFNPTERLWDGGYAMSLFPTTSGGMTWAVLRSVGDKYVGAGSIDKVSDSVEVHVWVSEVTASGHRLNVVIDGELVFSKALDGRVELGKRLYVFNNWNSTAIISKVDEVFEWDGKLPSNVTFESLAHTMRSEVRQVPGKQEGNLGTHTSTAHGFKFKLSGYTAEDAGTEVRVGFYNPESRLWDGGYAMSLFPTTSGGLDWSVLKPVGDKYIGAGSIDKISDAIEIYVWVSDITSSGHKLNVVIDGELVFSRKMDGSVKLGNNIFVYNGWNSMATFNSLEKLVWKKSKIPTDVTFEDIGMTLKRNEISTVYWQQLSLGRLNNADNGFQFYGCSPAEPAEADYGQPLKFGLYNLAMNAWNGGYLLQWFPNRDGSLDFSFCKATGEVVLDSVPNCTVVKTGETFLVSVWITYDDSEYGTHTVHVMINDIEMFTYSPESSAYVLLGDYMNSWSCWETIVPIKTITEVESFKDRYVRLFGNPMDMLGNTDENDGSEVQGGTIDGNTPDISVYVIVGAAVVVIAIGVAATLVVIQQKKKKGNNGEEK